MTREFETGPDLGEKQINDLLDDIEIRCSADVTAAREMSGVRTKVGIEVRPGNAADRGTLLATGETSELKSQGVTCMTDRPIAVGDVLHLTFERKTSDLAPILAVCDRCTMLGDTSFESRFKFVHEIVLPSNPDQ